MSNKELIDILTDIIEILERLCISSNVDSTEHRIIWDLTLLAYDKIKALEGKDD